MKGEDIRSKDHAFNVGIAIDHGIPAALLYREINYWCEENSSRGQNVRNGCAWMYRSLREFQEYFPEISLHVIRQGLDALKNAGLILDGDYNRFGLRTKWYTSQVSLFIPGNKPHLPNSTNGVPDSTNGVPDSSHLLLDSAQHLPDSAEQYHLDTSITNTGNNAGGKSRTSSSTAGAASSSRPTTTVFSDPHLRIIQRKTMGFKMEQLQELVELGDSEITIALFLYTVPDDKPLPWKSVYIARLEEVNKRKKEKHDQENT